MSRRHLAFAVVEYLRRLSRRDDAADIDMAEVNRRRGRVAWAIPSPGRREEAGWVLDSVPLVPHRWW